MLELDLLREPSFRAGLAANFAFLLYFASYMFTLTLFSQLGLGLDALHAGLVFTPTAVLFMTTAFVGHRLVARWGVRPIVYGALLTASSLVAVAVLVAARGEATSVIALTLIAAAMGPGNGLTLPSLIGAALVDVPSRHAGSAAGALTTVQQFAASSGVALIGTIYFAAAGTPAGRAGQAHGMVWATSVEAVLMVCVAVMVASGARHAVRRGRADEPGTESGRRRDNHARLGPCRVRSREFSPADGGRSAGTGSRRGDGRCRGLLGQPRRDSAPRATAPRLAARQGRGRRGRPRGRGRNRSGRRHQGARSSSSRRLGGAGGGARHRSRRAPRHGRCADGSGLASGRPHRPQAAPSGRPPGRPTAAGHRARAGASATTSWSWPRQRVPTSRR